MCKAALSVLQATLLLRECSKHKFLLIQATLFLIQGLDLEALLGLVAAGSPLSGSSHPFCDAASRQKAHDVLGTWWLQANEAHAPVLMAWAVLAALTSSISEGESNCAVKALAYVIVVELTLRRCLSSEESCLLLPVTLSETYLKGIKTHVQAFSLLKICLQVRAGHKSLLAAYAWRGFCSGLNVTA